MTEHGELGATMMASAAGSTAPTAAKLVRRRSIVFRVDLLFTDRVRELWGVWNSERGIGVKEL